MMIAIARTRAYPLLFLFLVTPCISLACSITSLIAGPPDLAVTSLKNGAPLLAGVQVEIAYRLDNVTEATKVTMSLEDRGNAVAAQDISPSASGNSAEGSLKWIPPSAGKYTLSLIATGKSGIASSPSIIHVNVYNRPTTVTVGTISLKMEDSFDFVTGQVGNLSGGDLFVNEGSECSSAWASYATNDPQMGGKVLDVDSTLNGVLEYPEAIESMHLDPNTRFCVPLNLNGLYAYSRNISPGNYIIFQVTSLTSDDVTLSYIVVDSR